VNISRFPASREDRRDVPGVGQADVAIFPGIWAHSSHLLRLQTIERHTPPSVAGAEFHNQAQSLLEHLPWHNRFITLVSTGREHSGDDPIVTKSVRSGNLQFEIGDRVDAGFARELENED
jgi:hypothetical protein